MELTIDHVENLTLNFSASGPRPSLASILPAFGLKVEKDCPCAICSAERDQAQRNGTQIRPPFASASSVELKIPALGEVWPGQGGVNGGLMASRGGASAYYLIVPTDACAAIEKIRWASKDHGDTAATSKDDGLANTMLLAESEFDFPAARWARGLEIDGHKDFYLPSQRELALCWVNVPELFPSGWYWSSTQYSRYHAWYQHFDDGYQGDTVKSAELRARPVRRLIP